MTNSPQPSLGAHGPGSPSLMGEAWSCKPQSEGGVRAFPGISNQAIIRRASWQLYPAPGPCLGNLLGVGTMGGPGEALPPWVTGVSVTHRAGEAQEAPPPAA